MKQARKEPATELASCLLSTVSAGGRKGGDDRGPTPCTAGSDEDRT